MKDYIIPFFILTIIMFGVVNAIIYFVQVRECRMIADSQCWHWHGYQMEKRMKCKTIIRERCLKLIDQEKDNEK